jgi:hypothetical protein
MQTSLRSAHKLLRHPLFSRGLWEHLSALLGAVVVSVALTWPTARSFTDSIAGVGEDPLHNVWTFWHAQQAIVGSAPLLYAPLLYYPKGISLLTHAPGPLGGIFALPFWPWGAEAAYNGSLLVGLSLTGYCMYLLARSLLLPHSVALFAGSVLMASPIGIGGLYGHIAKTFLGLLPLVILTTRYALDLHRGKVWVLAPGLILLLTALHDGYQFIFAAISAGFFALVAWATASRDTYVGLLKRSLFVALSTAILVGPLLISIYTETQKPEIFVDVSNESLERSPDLAFFVLPFVESRLLGTVAYQVSQQFDMINSGDRAITLSWASLLVVLVALLYGEKRVWPWLLFLLVCMALALGPSLRAFGNLYLSDTMPYAYFTQLPGLDFMRVPGRFMLPGYVGLSIAASYGLAMVLSKLTGWHRYILVGGAITLVLIPHWPEPIPQQSLPITPPFYHRIASDDEIYGVFDVPVKPAGHPSYVTYSAHYQIYQMTHQKGIAAGYLSRTYGYHPLFRRLMERDITPPRTHFLLNGTPINVYANAQAELASYGYRYVVWHKIDPNDQAVHDFLSAVFGTQTPFFEDAFTRVYTLNPDHRTTIGLGPDWSSAQPDGRWASSPARLWLMSPQAQPAWLQITPSAIYEPQANEALGQQGTLDVQFGSHPALPVDIQVNETVTLPLLLPEGNHPITLSLQAGNFKPAQFGFDDARLLSFAVETVNLQTIMGSPLSATRGILINGEAQQHADLDIVASVGPGWYPFDAQSNTRWAQSPSVIYVYSPEPRMVRFHSSAYIVYDPLSEYGIGTHGSLTIHLNDAPIWEQEIHTGEPFTADVDLQAGWNQIELMLAAGNFRPSDVQPGNGDQRLLSFLLGPIRFDTP